MTQKEYFDDAKTGDLAMPLLTSISSRPTRADRDGSHAKELEDHSMLW